MARSVEPHIWVSDLAASKSWYESLGFEERQRNPEENPTWFQLGVGDVNLMITTLPADIAPNQRYLTRVAERAGRGAAMALYLHVDSADDVHERAIAAGVDVIEDVWDPWWGGRQFTIADPDDNWWTVYQSSH